MPSGIKSWDLPSHLKHWKNNTFIYIYFTCRACIKDKS